MPIKLSKVENNAISDADAYAPSIKMGIDKAPSSLIVKYITHMYEAPLDAALRETVSNAFDALPHPLTDYDRDNKVRAFVMDDAGGFFGDFSAITPENPRLSPLRPGVFPERNRMYPRFHSFVVVRDDGRGMDYDTLVGVYTQYGVSDKRDDMEAIGAFGLGAKSPLAYASEFHVLTKTEDGECLYVAAYRTADEEFLANLPVELPQGESKSVSITRIAKDGNLHIVPPSELAPDGSPMPASTGSVPTSDSEDAVDAGANSGSDPDSDDTPIYQTITATLRSPFSAEQSGTVVIFPLDTSIAVTRAESIIKSMDSLMARTRTGRISDSPSAPVEYVELAPLEMDADDGESVRTRIFFPNEHSMSRVAASANRGYDPKNEEHRNMSVSFKVCNWLYPFSERWSSSYVSGRYDLPVVGDVIVDVPSGALPFIPSRDAVKQDDAVMRPLMDAIYAHIADCLKDPHACTELVNAFAAIPYSGYDVARGVSALLSTRATAFLDPSSNVVTYANHLPKGDFGYACAISLDELMLTPHHSATELYDSPTCMVGLCKSNEQGFVNKGVMSCGDSRLERLLGKAYRTDGTRGAGYSLAKSKTVADDIIAYENPLPSRDDDIALASIPDQDSKKATHSFFDCLFPVASALPHVLSKHCAGEKTALIVVDGSHVKKLGSIRSSIVNVLANNGVKNDNYENVVYVIIPRKTADGSEKWAQSEIAALHKQLKDIAVDTGMLDEEDVFFQKAITLAKNMKKQATKEALRKEETDELAKMFRLGTVTFLNNANASERTSAFKTRFPKTRMDEKDREMFSDMLERSDKWGIVVMDDCDNASSLAATGYGQTLIAMGIVADDVSILGLSSRNFNKKRADIAKRQGIAIIYDETGKGGFGSDVPPGRMTYGKNGIQVHGPIPKDVRAMKASREYEAWGKSFMVKATNVLLNNESYETRLARTISQNTGGCDHDANELLGAMTFGMLQHDVPDTIDSCGWKNDVLYAATWDNECTESQIEERERFGQQVNGAMEIWKSYLAPIALSIDVKRVKPENLGMLSTIGHALGIDLAVKTMIDGVPVADVCA